jgi:hypothetical protein
VPWKLGCASEEAVERASAPSSTDSESGRAVKARFGWYACSSDGRPPDVSWDREERSPSRLTPCVALELDEPRMTCLRRDESGEEPPTVALREERASRYGDDAL